MFVVLKRSNIFILAASVMLSVATVNMVKNSPALPASSAVWENKVIVLDAGHGGFDGGAVGISGAVEKEINLEITLKLKALLEKTGAKVVVTRQDDTALAETKKEDMRKRKEIKESSGADIFVSIHMNKFSQEKYSGAQVFYANDEKSQKLGEHIQSAMVNLLNPENNRKAKATDGNVYILKESGVPSVIVECGFLSNAEEEGLLKQKDYQQKVAWSIYSGVLKYFDEG